MRLLRLLAFAVGTLLAQPAFAQGLLIALTGYEEAPPISTAGNGELALTLIGPQLVEYNLTYQDLEGAVQQAHLHFGQTGVNGGIVVFLCTNLGNGPAGTPTCPPQPGEVLDQFGSAQILGIPSQGFAEGQFAALFDASINGRLYANLHTDLFPGGEIRGQLQ